MNMLKSVVLVAVCLIFMVSTAKAADDRAANDQPTVSTTGATGNHATKEQAVAMVKKAVDFIKTNGTEKGYAEIDRAATTKDGQFIDRDLYIVVYTLEGTCVAHGANPKMIDQDLLDTEDADGKPFVRERVELGKTNQSFWQDYKYTDPVTKKIAPKETYCERLDDTVVCGGVYKD